MKTIIKSVALTITVLAATPVLAQSAIAELCGSEHVNEAVERDDVRANPGGYFITSLGEQLSFGDPRIVQAVGHDFYFCTRSAATPDMETERALKLMQERRVRYLFVPFARDIPGSG